MIACIKQKERERKREGNLFISKVLNFLNKINLCVHIKYV